MVGSTSHRRVAALVAGAAVLATVLAVSTTPDTATDDPRLGGATVEVLAVWSGVEQESFERVLDRFERRTGARVVYSSAGHGVVEALTRRLAEGRLPDVAFLPQPGLLRRYAREGHLVPLGPAAREVVERNYTDRWRRLGTVDGRLYGVWFKAANKSLVWYDVRVFERAGLVPPTDVEGLLAAARRLAADGVAAFSVAGADGWTLTDWFENLYLRMAGPERYDRLAEHRLSWNDASVKGALRAMAELLQPAHVAGGPAAALQTTFDASVERMFAEPPAAAMVMEGDFVAGLVTGRTGAELGVDADVFSFPAAGRSGPTVMGGGDAAVLMRRSEAGAALVRYLATPEAAAVWAARGGFISPNTNVDLSVYPDEISRSLARSVLEAGDDFRFDLSDLQPSAFGAARDRGMRKVLQDFLAHPDVDATAARLEAEASEAFRP